MISPIVSSGLGIVNNFGAIPGVSAILFMARWASEISGDGTVGGVDAETFCAAMRGVGSAATLGALAARFAAVVFFGAVLMEMIARWTGGSGYLAAGALVSTNLAGTMIVAALVGAGFAGAIFMP